MNTTTAPDLIPPPSARQREAIEAELGPQLVVAGPGAGKTFCLIERIRFLLEHHGLEAPRICAVTFTNKAAQEIAERLQRTMGPRGKEVKGGTLHALCAEILREHGEWVGVRRGFGIADEDYQRGVLRRLGVWPRRQGQLLIHFGLHRANGRPLVPAELALFQRYQEHLARRNQLDFDDLVLRTAELLAQYEEVAALVRGRWDYLLVDEFQDLNPRQYAIVRHLAEPHSNLFVVGDDEQSVFSWTGADPEVLRRFLNDFHQDRYIVLDENRRTAQQIFAVARRLLRHNPNLFEKELRAERSSEHAVRVQEFADEQAEASWLLADLVADQLETGLPWGEYGVLYRRHEIGDVLEGALLCAGIPCRLASGRALQDDRVVRYLVAALRVIGDPGDPLRREAFARVVLPATLWATIVSEAERRKLRPLVWMKKAARLAPRTDQDGKKLRRAYTALQNLPALAYRHATLASLVEELLSQRVGTYRTVLEDRHDELSDPADDAATVLLAERLRGALHGRNRVWLPRAGGLELALSGLLLKTGITSVAYLDDHARPNPGELRLTLGAGGRYGPALGLFKALQLVHGGELQDAFQDFVSVDLETTDLDPATCHIVELSAFRVRQGEIVAEYHQLVRPPGPISEGARRTHGISDADVRDAPTLEEVWPGFRSFCGEEVLVAHNGTDFDFPVLKRSAHSLLDEADFVTFDSLPLARNLHSGSCRLGDLAHTFGIPLPQAHRAQDDARALVGVFRELQRRKLAWARKTSLVDALDYLGLAFAFCEPAALPAEERWLYDIARKFALGRYSDCLEHYRMERDSPLAFDAPTLDQVIQRLGGRGKLEETRREKQAGERYPAAMARLRRLLEQVSGDSLAAQVQSLLDRIALSSSKATESDPELRHRVNLLTLHSTKGLEFSRVYLIGVEDAEMPGIPKDGSEVPLEELQEARRLLYVGMTRAKDRLILTRSERRKDLPTGGTRFLTEMGLMP